MRLANRRFVPFYFDLNEHGAAGDGDARKFVVAAKPELAGQSVSPPDVSLHDAEGRILGSVSNFADADAYLKEMIRVLKGIPGALVLDEEERKAPPLEQAEAWMDLLDYDAASALLEGIVGQAPDSRASFLLGRIARLRGDREGMERRLAEVKDGALGNDVRMERARALWDAREFEALREALQELKGSEARYLEGLALFHLGKREEALKAWKEAVLGHPQDPWVYRADWAYSSVLQAGKAGFSTADARVSLLGRIGYLGGSPPDLLGKLKGRKEGEAGFAGLALAPGGEGKGLSVAGVVPEGPAEKAGLKEGDRLLSIEGKPMGAVEDAVALIRASKPGTELKVGILRDGTELELTLKVGSRR